MPGNLLWPVKTEGTSTMGDSSVLLEYFACSGEVAMEDEWIDQTFARLRDEVTRGDLARATKTCERFLVDLEGHFAFEDIVMAQTGFSSGRAHFEAHAAGLTAMGELVLAMHAAADSPDRSARCAKLLDHLSATQRHTHAHIARHDCLLKQHVLRKTGLADG
jgi:hemerythrin